MTSVSAVSPHADLEDLTPEDIQEIGSEYGVEMTGRAGTQPADVAIVSALSVILFLLAFVLTLILSLLIGITNLFDVFLLTVGLWMLGMGATARFWLVWNPKFTGLITTDAFTKMLHPYGTGLGLKRPWRTYSPEEDFIDMRGDLATGTQQFLSSDGVPVDFGWGVQFGPFLPMLPLYVRMENAVLERGLEEIAESVLSHSMLGKAMDQVRQPASVDEVRANLRQALAGVKVGEANILDVHQNSIEERFGLKVEYITLSPPKPDADYIETLVGQVKVRKFVESAKDITKPDPVNGWSGMSSEKAMRVVQIANKEAGVTDQSITVDLSERAKEAAGDIGQVLKAAAPIVESVVRGKGAGSADAGGKS